MNRIGRKIFYEVATGNIITDTGERQGAVIATTIEQDIATFTALSERNRETFDVVTLEYGQYAEDFAACNGYKVVHETKKIVFSYPDPNDPEKEPEYIPPLSEKVESMQTENAELIFQNAMQDMAISKLQGENADLMFKIAMLEASASV